MVGHNNMIPNGHFHKNWQANVHVNFNQTQTKFRHWHNRVEQIRAVCPQPVYPLRPVIHCPTLRYNTKIRIGRGFTLAELAQAGINKRFARTVGISVDYRRNNNSVESIQENVARLNKYLQNLILDPSKNPGAIQFNQTEINNLKPEKAKVHVEKLPSNNRTMLPCQRPLGIDKKSEKTGVNIAPEAVEERMQE